MDVSLIRSCCRFCPLQPLYFKKSLESVLSQSPSSLEILIGLKEEEAKGTEEILRSLSEEERKKITLFFFPFTESITTWINALASKATKEFLFVMGENDWIRPDLFFRYEQTLRLFPDPRPVVLFCNSNQINGKDYFIPSSEYRQPEALLFPFFFKRICENRNVISEGPCGKKRMDFMLNFNMLNINILYFKWI